MFYRTKAECDQWASGRGHRPEELVRLQSADFSGPDAIRIFLGEPYRATNFPLARHLVSSLGRFQACLLWITEFGIWPSSENLHLYSRLRGSYGDHRPYWEAPGHEFLDFEVVDLATFIHVVILFGWAGYVLAGPMQPRMFISHDEWISIDCRDENAARGIATFLEEGEYRFRLGLQA